LQAARDDVEAKALLKEMLVSTNHELRGSLSGDRDNIYRSYDGSAFVNLKESVRQNTEVCEASKKEISAIQESVSDLRQAETELQNQHLRLLEQCRKEEERGEVTGFQDIHEHLIAASKETSSMNELMSQTLEEMSDLSQNIINTIDKKKHVLEPKLRQIKDERKHFQEIREMYVSDKAKYDGAVERFTADINVLESEWLCLQKDWIEKERLLCAKNGSAAFNLPTLPNLGNLTKKRCEHGTNQSTEFANLKKLLELQAGVPRQ
jgi:hypothetical protein